MDLRKYSPEKDFDIIKNWIDDERTHAMWCANLFEYPLNRENVAEVLEYALKTYGDIPYIAMKDGREAGFFCYHTNQTTKEGMLKFVIVNPEYRGNGIANEMLKAVLEHAFREAGAELVQLNVFPENIRAKKCYENAGFIERNITENAFAYKNETWGRCNMIIRPMFDKEIGIEIP